MVDIVTQKQPAREVWLHQLTDSVTNPTELLAILGLEQDENWRAGTDARRLFALRVPRPFIAKMEKGNPCDPLLLQTMTHRAEFDLTRGSLTIRWMNNTVLFRDYCINITTRHCC